MVLEIQKEQLKRILLEFKTGAYAGAGPKAYLDTTRGTKIHVRQDGPWTFFDEYAGDAFYSGWEYLMRSNGTKNVEVWSMVYRGTILEPGIKQHTVYDFLREALKKMPADLPFRGPSEFTSEKFPDLQYLNNILRTSNPTDGFGMESIFFKDKKVYFGIWSGGLVLENFDDIKLV